MNEPCRTQPNPANRVELDQRIRTRTEYSSGTVAELFGTRIGGNSKDTTSSGAGIGFLVVLDPVAVLVTSRLVSPDENRRLRMVLKTKLRVTPVARHTQHAGYLNADKAGSRSRS